MVNFNRFQFIYKKFDGNVKLVMDELSISQGTFYNLKRKLKQTNPLPIEKKIKKENVIKLGDSFGDYLKGDPRLECVVDEMFEIALSKKKVNKINADMCYYIVNVFGHLINAKKLATSESKAESKDKDPIILDLLEPMAN